MRPSLLDHFGEKVRQTNHWSIQQNPSRTARPFEYDAPRQALQDGDDDVDENCTPYSGAPESCFSDQSDERSVEPYSHGILPLRLHTENASIQEPRVIDHPQVPSYTKKGRVVLQERDANQYASYSSQQGPAYPHKEGQSSLQSRLESFDVSNDHSTPQSMNAATFRPAEKDRFARNSALQPQSTHPETTAKTPALHLEFTVPCDYNASETSRGMASFTAEIIRFTAHLGSDNLLPSILSCRWTQFLGGIGTNTFGASSWVLL
jgi:hypothetical protein